MVDGRVDLGRAEVYACEVAAFEGTDLEDVRPFGAIASLVARVVEGRWWTGPPVRVEAARRDASSSATHGPVPSSPAAGDEHSPVTIRVAAPQATVATAAHELAHALAGIVHGHGALYRRAYVDVVTVITNLDEFDRRGAIHATQLTDAFAAAGLPMATRNWPPPDDSIGGPIAL